MKIWIRSCAGICALGLLCACDRVLPPGSISLAPLSKHALETPRSPPYAAQPAGSIGNRAYLQYAVLDVAPGDMPRATDGGVDTKARKSEAETDAKVNATANLAGNDRNFIQRIGNDGQSEEQAALYVASKTLNKEVRGYAAQMGRDHGKANQQLRKMAAQRGIEVPADPDGVLSAKLDRLRQMTGPQMDAAFLQDFGVQAHMDMIALFEVQASQSQDKDLKAFAEKQLPILRRHYKQGTALQEKYAPVTGRLDI